MPQNADMPEKMNTPADADRGGLIGHVYRGAAALAAMGLRLRAAAGNATWRARLALDDLPQAAPIWLHAASVGELTSARAIIAELARDPGIVVTTNSITGRDLARAWGLAAHLAPFDATGPTARFIAAARPSLQITIEGEFWPVRSQLLARYRIPQAFIGARMSDRSARRWLRLSGLIGPVLGRVTALSAQDADSEARLLLLGLPRAALMPRLDLKLIDPAAVQPPGPNDLRDRTFLAASTHEGEDAPILDAYLTARAEHPGLRLILAPRHPQRGDEIAAMMAARGLTFQRRSAGGTAEADILLADTLGEMAEWYAQAGICLTGGSLVDRGGHTPWEPAARQCAIMHGPHVSNFSDSYGRLDSAGAAIAANDRDLGTAIAAMAADPTATRAMGRAARQVLMDGAGDPTALLARLRKLARGPDNADIMNRKPRGTG